MNLKRITIALLALGALFTACKQEEELGVPKLTIDPTEISLDKGEASATVSILATRNWYIANKPDWAALNIEKGDASTKNQTVTISVDANKGYDRKGEIKFSIGLAKAVLTVNQKGDKGVLSLGSGTKDDPYTVAGIIAYTSSLGKDEESPSTVFFKGTVSSVVTTFEGSGNYGNATFYIADPDGGDQFYCYQTYYLGNRKWKSGDTEIKVDDEVIMCGKVVNYKGNTPETVGKGGSFIYSLNGKSEGGGSSDTGNPAGSGTKEDPYNVAAAIKAVEGLTWTANDNYQKVGPYYVKGIVSTVDEAYSAQFGNGTFHIKDADADAEFYVFRALYLNNKKWTSSDAQIKVGDEVIIYAELMNYRGNTPETVQNSGYLYSLNGNTGGGNTPPDTPGTPSGNGTLDSPFNVAAAINAVKGLTWTSKDVYDKVGPYYVKGVISTVDEAYSAQFGNGTFHIKDADASAEFYVYRTLYLGNKKWVEGNTQIKVGDEVIIYAELMNYHGDTPETVQNGGYLYSLNGDTGGGETPPDNPGTPSGNGTLESPYNAAAAYQLAAGLDAESKTGDVYIAGKISSIKYTFNSQYGTATFDISDDGSTTSKQFTCYSVLYLENTPWKDGQTQVKVGDSVIVYGKLCNYQGNTPETASKEAYIYSLNGKTEDDGSQGGGGGEEQEDGDFSSNVTWELGANGYDQDANVNGVTGVKVLKLGKGSDWGSAVLTLPSACTKLTFYAVSWNNVDVADLVFSVNGKDVATVTPKANSGLKGNPTYTLTVTSADKYSVDLGSATTTVSVKTSGGYRAALFGIKAE